MKSAAFSCGSAAVALAQGTAWSQCGGIGWTGVTTCGAGLDCVVQNPYYSQCLPVTSSGTTTVVVAPSTLTTLTRATTSAASKTTTKATVVTSSSTSKATTATTKTTTKATVVTSSSTSTSKATSTVSTKAAAATTTSSSASSTSTTGWKWLGASLSGAEFGGSTLPGTDGTTYTFPDSAAITTLLGQGYNIFRVPFMMERLVPNELTGAVDATYMSKLTTTVNQITSGGAYAVLDPHNYGRYYNNIITDTAGFQAWWKTVATAFASNSKVIFDTNNEYNSMDQTLVLELNQAAIDGIRSAGATSQYIFVEGNSWSGAHSWVGTNDNLVGLTDSADKIIYEMHQYLDNGYSGTSADCISESAGVDALTSATAWLRANKKTGVIGEFAGGANPTCEAAVKNMLDYMTANDDVWSGGLWWAAGPWWGSYMFSFEPPSGTGYSYYNSLLKTYLP
ncbi:glycoside hydrolase superfamily [Xylariaceae sp. FL1272]|nr:glycoside hydrolase superfamily [Xylariaceae sp. FL1272]